MPSSLSSILSSSSSAPPSFSPSSSISSSYFSSSDSFCFSFPFPFSFSDLLSLSSSLLILTSITNLIPRCSSTISPTASISSCWPASIPSSASTILFKTPIFSASPFSEASTLLSLFTFTIFSCSFSISFFFLFSSTVLHFIF